MFFHRVYSLFQKVPSYDVSLSHFSGHAIYASLIRRRPIIAITDNDINPDNHLFLKFIDFLFVPSVIDKKRFFEISFLKMVVSSQVTLRFEDFLLFTNCSTMYYGISRL